MLAKLLDNPISSRELYKRMRDRRTFTLITVYLILAGLVIGLVYYTETEYQSTFTPDSMQELGKTIFYTLFLIELLMVNFIAPGLTSGAIAGERELRTLDLLKTTLVTPFELIAGKLLPSFAYIVLLILVTLPIQSAAFFLGGVGLPEMLVSIAILLVNGAYMSALGLFFSCGLKKTTAASTASYAFIFAPIILYALFYFMVNLLPSDAFNDFDETYWFLFGAWTIVSSHPLLAAGVSYLLLIEEQAIFFVIVPSMGKLPATLMLTPWLIYVIHRAIMIFALIIASARLVSIPEKN